MPHAGSGAVSIGPSTISWLEVITGVLNDSLVILLARPRLLCLSFVFLVYVAFCFLAFGCHYQCS